MSVLLHLAGWLVGLKAAETQTTGAERAALAAHARGATRIAEVGVWHGVTTRILADALAPGGVLWAIDPFPRGRLGFSPQRIVAHGHVGKPRSGTVRWVRASGEEAAALYASAAEPPLDLIFIDGDHSYDAVVRDWRAWRSLIRPGGVVALHDSRSTPERRIDDAGSVVATQTVVLKDADFELAAEVDSLTIVRRKRPAPQGTTE